MSSKLSYSFSVLRYVHDMMTGEFVNVGLVLFVPATGLLLVRTSSSIARLRAVFPDIQRPAFTATMKSIERAGKKLARRAAEGPMLGETQTAAQFGTRLVPDDDSALQWAPMGGGITDDPRKTFGRLFERQVERYNTTGTSKLTDDDVWKPVRERLAAKRVGVEFVEKIVTGLSDEIEFKHAWKNTVWHAYEPLSFDLANADSIKEKARRWRGHLDAVRDGANVELRLNFVVAAPRHDALLPAYQKALAILEKAAFAPTIFDEANVDSLVDHIEDEVRAHTGHTN